MMTKTLENSRDHFIQGMSRISHFWGFPKAMGAIYGAIYLSPSPLSLNELVEQVGVTKGAVSTNVRQLERLGMVNKHIMVGERKDYYFAETDFWKIAKGILKEREQSEFDQALRTVAESIQMTLDANTPREKKELANFYQSRMQAMESFFNSLDNLVAMLLAIDELRSNTIQNLFRKSGDEGN